NDVLAGVGILELHPRAAVQQLGTELVAGHFVAPLLEGTFGELHDVALVHDGHGAAVVVYRILQCLAHQAHGALLGYRLDADTANLGKADLVVDHFHAQEPVHLLGFMGAWLRLVTGVHVFGVLAVGAHVHVAGVLHRAGDAGEPADLTLTDIEVQLLTQRHVQRTDTAAHRRGQGALDGDNVVLHSFQGFFREPGVLIVNLSGFLAGVDFHPGNLALATVGLLNGSVDDFHHDGRNIDTDTITFDEGNDRVVR